MIAAVKNSHQVYAKRLEEQTKEKLVQKQKNEEAKKKREEEEMKGHELKKMEEKKEQGVKRVQLLQKDLDQEYDAAAKLVSEGSKRLSIALSEKDMDEVTIATALIDSANKIMDAVREKRDTLSLK